MNLVLAVVVVEVLSCRGWSLCLEQLGSPIEEVGLLGHWRLW